MSTKISLEILYTYWCAAWCSLVSTRYRVLVLVWCKLICGKYKVSLFQTGMLSELEICEQYCSESYPSPLSLRMFAQILELFLFWQGPKAGSRKRLHPDGCHFPRARLLFTASCLLTGTSLGCGMTWPAADSELANFLWLAARLCRSQMIRPTWGERGGEIKKKKNSRRIFHNPLLRLGYVCSHWVSKGQGTTTAGNVWSGRRRAGQSSDAEAAFPAGRGGGPGREMAGCPARGASSRASVWIPPPVKAFITLCHLIH